MLTNKSLLVMPRWMRERMRNFIVSGLVAYVACVFAVWYLQPADSRPIFLLMPLLWAAVYSVLATLSRGLKGTPLGRVVTFAGNERHRFLITRFRKRAMWARYSARFFLAMILVTLGAGGFVFVKAALLVREDAAHTLLASTAQVQDSLSAIDPAALQEAAALGMSAEDLEAVSKARIELEALRAASGKPAASGTPEAADEVLRKVDEFVSAREQLAQVSGALEQMRADIAATRAAIESQNHPDAMAQFFVVQFTRFGMVGVVVALVLVLGQLYKYNVRLAAHYDARADVIEIVRNDDIEKLVQGVEMFSPDALDFTAYRAPRPAPQDPIGNNFEVPTAEPVKTTLVQPPLQPVEAPTVELQAASGQLATTDQPASEPVTYS